MLVIPELGVVRVLRVQDYQVGQGGEETADSLLPLYLTERRPLLGGSWVGVQRTLSGRPIRLAPSSVCEWSVSPVRG